ncbi:MAG: phosphatase PAP2 family protein [Sphingobacteriales bacterium]|nr:phosphatase PAP2 family protein [Sphingobacteriales bacterium]
MKNKKFILLIITFVLLVLLVAFCLQANSWIIPQYGTADTQLFLKINGLHHAFFDPIMYALSSKLFWIPFYAALIWWMWKRFGKQVLWVLLFVALMITSADRISSGILKNSVKRLRPSHEMALSSQIHLSKAGPGGNYGFVSSHATNCFSLSLFLWMVLPAKDRNLKIVILFWAIFVSYSRIYNGVHYPLDVFFGGLIGTLIGLTFGQLYQLFFPNQKI